MLQHQGTLFEYPVEDSDRKLTFQDDMNRHIKAYEKRKEYVCAEPGYGKVFKYPSKSLKHEDSHVKLDSVEALCSEPGCMKYFANKQCLKEHMHRTGVSSYMFKRCLKRCRLKFSNPSNRNQHIKAVHLELKPHTCSILACCKKFSCKHVWDNHEKSGCHIYMPGKFEESD